MIDKIKILINKYIEIEKDIEKEIKLLPRYGKTCNCKEPEVFKQVFSGYIDEIIKTCLKCGGYIEN